MNQQPRPTQFASMNQLSAALKVPMEILKQAKRSGCHAFKSSGKVDAAQFFEWLFSQENDSGVDWGRKLKEFQAKREENKYEAEKRRLVSKPFIKQECQGALALLFGELDRLFCSELPASLVGKSEAQIRQEALVVIEQCKANLASRFERASNGEEPETGDTNEQDK